MADNLNIDSKRWAGFAVAVLMCQTTGSNLSGLMYDLLPYDLAKLIGPFIGYGFTGILLGLCMFYFLGSKAKYFLKWLPLLLLGVVVLNVFFASGSGDWSVFGILGHLLTRLYGYSYLFFLPFVSAIAIYFFETRKKGDNADSTSFMHWLKSALVE